MTEPIPPPPVEGPAEPPPPPPVVEPAPEPPTSVAEEAPPAAVAEEPTPPAAEESPPSPVVEEPSPPPAAEEPPPSPPVAVEPEPPTSEAAPEPAPLPQIAQAPEAKPVEPPPPPMEEPSGSLEDVYFDFDQSALREDARATLEDNAKLLRNTSDGRVIIEGHCDERGTSAYNLILGEQRAKSVKRYLENLGIEASSLSIVSYGKERPFCKEHNDECWQSNRRAHFIMK
ncbi:hypothetical protein YTPLAS18_33970 [Nitrospira sp.]|nr:hypothetical protein YTPLAS18_33970 [Nitrospira sp.]